MTPALSGHAQLLGQLQDTQLGLDTLSHVPQPWTDRLAHLVGKFCALHPSILCINFCNLSWAFGLSRCLLWMERAWLHCPQMQPKVQDSVNLSG